MPVLDHRYYDMKGLLLTQAYNTCVPGGMEWLTAGVGPERSGSEMVFLSCRCAKGSLVGPLMAADGPTLGGTGRGSSSSSLSKESVSSSTIGLLGNLQEVVKHRENLSKTEQRQ